MKIAKEILTKKELRYLDEYLNTKRNIDSLKELNKLYRILNKSISKKLHYKKCIIKSPFTRFFIDSLFVKGVIISPSCKDNIIITDKNIYITICIDDIKLSISLSLNEIIIE